MVGEAGKTCRYNQFGRISTVGRRQCEAEFSYGEGVDMLQHALQAAYCASAQGEATDAVLAAVMHAIGNSPQARAAWVAAGNSEPPLLISRAIMQHVEFEPRLNHVYYLKLKASLHRAVRILIYT